MLHAMTTRKKKTPVRKPRTNLHRKMQSGMGPAPKPKKTDYKPVAYVGLGTLAVAGVLYLWISSYPDPVVQEPVMSVPITYPVPSGPDVGEPPTNQPQPVVPSDHPRPHKHKPKVVDQPQPKPKKICPKPKKPKDDAPYNPIGPNV
jgi:hypothetical protein